ncbi:MAG: PEP-CTERM sorting domain-containing protein, partial [Verrucomicrobia bacterium]|nr:PEP-CTERM sorting domain-containing protein [Verrucomicrobiota bacterium]
VSLQSAGVTLSDGGGGGSIQTVAAAAGSSYTTGAGNLNSTFTTMNTGGTWTLFLADMATGDQSTLVSWGLNVSVVPEPATWALAVFAIGFMVMGLTRHLRRDKVGTAAH